jgi:phosphoserine phosphatase
MAKAPLRLAIFDIDGTLRRVRDPWIHLHNHLGVADQAKDLPARWQRGEISYEEWARLDAACWRGHTLMNILGALETNPYRDGAKELIGWFTSISVPCVGISSGLSVFNEITARELGIEEIISNELHFEGDTCNGVISIYVHEKNKGKLMGEILECYAVSEEQVVAFGDGRADIPMLRKAGLGVAIFPSHDEVRSSADAVVRSEPIDRAIPVIEKHFRVSFSGFC